MTSTAPTASPEANGRNSVEAHTRIFRGILQAMSRPGTIAALDGLTDTDTPLPTAIAAAVQCLCDFETPIWLDAALDIESVRRYLRLYLGAPMVTEPGKALFALIGAPAEMPPLEAFAPGREDYPDRSTTLVVQTAGLSDGSAVGLIGPGIEHRASIAPQGLPHWFWPAWDANAGRFPLGVDILLTDGSGILGLPRTTRRA